jgi:nuclear pore complex protein Nup188
VVLGEPISLGTLLELGRCTLDHLEDLQNPDTRPSLERNVLQAAESTAIRTLDVVLMYAVTQLAIWLSKPEFEAPVGDMETEEQHLLESRRGDVSKERRAPILPLTLPERLRRGIMGELATDLQSLLDKAKAIKRPDGDLDLSQVLSNFLRDRTGAGVVA